MNDLLETMGPLLIILMTLLMFVFVMQILNDATCAAMDEHAPIGNGLIKLLALCW